MIPHDAGLPDPTNNPPPGRRELPPVAGRIEPAAAAAEPPAPPPALSSGPELGALLKALQRRWAAAVLLGGSLAILAGLAAWFLLSPKYTAIGQVRVAYDPDLIFAKNNGVSRTDFKTYLQTQAGTLTSRKIIAAALNRDEVKRLNLDASDRDPVTSIQEELKAEFQETSELINVLYNNPDPAVATTVVKAIIAEYMDQIVYAESGERGKRVAGLDKEYAEANEALMRKRRRVTQVAEDLKVEDPRALAQQQMELMNSVNQATAAWNQSRSELLKARADLKGHEARMKALENNPVPESALESAVEADPRSKGLQVRIEKMQNLVERFRRDTYPGDPERVRVEAHLHDLEGQLEARRKTMREQLKKRLEKGARESMAFDREQKASLVKTLEEVEAQARAEVERLGKQSRRIKTSAPELDNLQAEIGRDEKLLDDLGKRLTEERFNLKAAQRITVFQEAELQKKDMKKQVLGAVAAPVAALFLVCMGLAWAEHRHRRIRSAVEVAQGLGIRVVGSVPESPDLERHLVGAGAEGELEGHAVLESIDALRTLVLRDAEAAGTRVVMVTSAVSGEGKTTLAGHLAGSLARAGRRTLLIDGDLRTPAAHQLFELPMQPGFSEVLLGEVEMADAVQETSLDGLWLMAAGQWDREVLLALARDGLEGIFEKLNEEFDFIVIDSHPVLPATDSLLIGQHVDTVILSVLSEVSQMPRVYAASQRLTSLGIRVLGAVVSGTDPDEVFTGGAPAQAIAG